MSSRTTSKTLGHNLRSRSRAGVARRRALEELALQSYLDDLDSPEDDSSLAFIEAFYAAEQAAVDASIEEMEAEQMARMEAFYGPLPD